MLWAKRFCFGSFVLLIVTLLWLWLTQPVATAKEWRFEDMNADQLRELITVVLEELDLYSEDAVELLMLTAAQESHLGKYIRQINGPALGIFQMEPSTERDIWYNYLRYKPDIARRVYPMVGNSNFNNLQLFGNLLYQIAMARIHYLRVPKALPSKDDVDAMARYWKRYYNTPLGKGTTLEAVANYRRYCV